jgi:hypothetical protein
MNVVHDHHHRQPQGGPVVLDIGDGIGALVVLMDHDALGTELHLRSEHDPLLGVHTGVWQRGHGAGVITVAVFGELASGSYWVLDAGGGDVRRVEIQDGAVTTIDLRR